MQRLIKTKSNIKYIKRIFKCKSFGPKHLRLKSVFLKTRLSLIIFIRVFSNNVFFCLFDRRQKKTLLSASSGALKVKITKKRIKHQLGWLIDSFLGGSVGFGFKISIFVILFVWVRAALPRYRYDQLMSLGWKVFLPLSLAYFLFTLSILISFNLLPF